MLSIVLLLSLAQPAHPAKVTIVFGGDVIPHDPVKFVARMHARTDAAGQSVNAGGWDHIFGPLSTIFKRNDLAIVNLESPVVTTSTVQTGDMVFHAPPQLLEGLKRAGVSVATFANNHCLDQNREGIISTRRALSEAGLSSAGAAETEAAAWEPLIIDKNGVRIGLLAITRWLNGFQNLKNPARPHVPTVPYPGETLVGGRSPAAVADLVKAAAADVDVLIVSVHWGEEYKSAPSDADRQFAKQLLDAGAAAVIGHHPHVLQPVDWVERADGSRGLVAYSLGNLVSNQDFDNAAGLKRDSLLLELTLERPAPGLATRLTAVEGVAIATENRLGRGRERNVQPVVLDDEVSAIDARLEVLATRSDASAVAETRVLTKRLALLRDRLERIHAVLGPAAVLAGMAPR